MTSYRFFTTPEQVGAAIRDGRKSLRLTQQQLADKAGVSRGFVIDLEAGHQRAELGKVLAVLKAANVRAYALPPEQPRPNPQFPIDVEKAMSRFD